VTNLFVAAQDQVSTAVLEIIDQLSRNTSMQKSLFQSLENESVDEHREIVQVILENLRSSKTTEISRNGSVLAHNNLDPAVVGPEPTEFNPQRFGSHMRVTKNWTGLPFRPFGDGPHTCPGWRFYQETSIAFVTALVKHCEWTVQPGDKIHFTKR
jgi:hypothetical protein